jgi:hypothetical protein
MPPIGNLLDLEIRFVSFAKWQSRCRPRVLIVVDGGINYSESLGFGITRFIQAISGSSLAPILTLADRETGTAGPITIYNTPYTVIDQFDFHAANPAVTTANYDQVWLFAARDDSMKLSDDEVRTLADFMNAGGGVFATGDHATLGQGMGAHLPRVRYMREWASIPMGGEGHDGARDRIDTIVNPGDDSSFDFDDQSDLFPQRIYPNYAVSWTFGTWKTTLHPLLRMPNAPVDRFSSADLTNDIDMMPDHAHESVCYEVSPSVNNNWLIGNFQEAARNFPEFPLAVASSTTRVGSEILAYAVSGGRAPAGKPPVRPRMFGISSVFDGHAAEPYTANGPRPGRILCDATWHHFLNINLDGTDTAHSGLGSGSGLSFDPSPDLDKIYQYFRNAINWLQPANRIWCSWWWDLVAVAYNPHIYEYLINPDEREDPAVHESVGAEAVMLLDSARGRGSALDAVVAALRLSPEASALAERAEAAALLADDRDGRALAYIVGRTLAHLARALPLRNPKEMDRLLGGKRHEAIETDTAKAVASAWFEAVAIQSDRAEKRLGTLRSLRGPSTAY